MQKYYRTRQTSNFGFGLGAIKNAAGAVGSKLGGAVNTISALSTPLFLAPLFVPGADTKLQAKIQEDRLKEQENEMKLQGIEPPAPEAPVKSPNPRTNTVGNIRTTNMNPEMIQRPPMRPGSL